MATIRLLQHLYEKIETFYGGIDYNSVPNEDGEKNVIPKDRMCEDDPEDQYNNEGKPQWLLDMFYRIDKTSGETCTVKRIRAPKGTFYFTFPWKFRCLHLGCSWKWKEYHDRHSF